VAIQSASALNAYVTAASSAPVSAANTGAADSAAEGGTAPDASSAGLNGKPRLAQTAAPQPAQDQAASQAQGEADETTGEAPAGAQSKLSAMYGNNARSVAAGMPRASISLLA
jgi:hypothetical protein